MHRKKTIPARLNIYVNDPAIRRHVKTAAAKRDISVSEYCLGAITLQLIKDGEMPRERKTDFHKAAIEKARRFQAETFGGRVFSVSSADLVKEARESRNV